MNVRQSIPGSRYRPSAIARHERAGGGHAFQEECRGGRSVRSSTRRYLLHMLLKSKNEKIWQARAEMMGPISPYATA